VAAVSSEVLDRKQRSLGRFKTVTPLDHHGAPLKELVQAEVSELGSILQAVEIDVGNLHATGVDADELKGWARDVSGRAHATHQATDECRLACAKVAFDENQVA